MASRCTAIEYPSGSIALLTWEGVLTRRYSTAVALPTGILAASVVVLIVRIALLSS
jgi:hypothetical protein